MLRGANPVQGSAWKQGAPGTTHDWYGYRMPNAEQCPSWTTPTGQKGQHDASELTWAPVDAVWLSAPGGFTLKERAILLLPSFGDEAALLHPFESNIRRFFAVNVDLQVECAESLIRQRW